jgi:serine/threonine protein kinase
MGVNALPPLQSGDVLQGRYSIVGLISQGTNNVYLGRDQKFSNAVRNIAVKEFLIGVDVERDDLIRKFNRQANILAQLSHPTIPQIIDFFDLGDRAYIIMQYIDGNSLEYLLHQDVAIQPQKILEWAIDICDALHYLHTYQPEPIMFRLVKPSSVVVDKAGKARLVGFGTAKTFAPNSKGTQIGVEGYSAPESYKGYSSPLSDMFSLAATLHHMLTQADPRLEPPFSFFERPISKYISDGGAEIETVISKALQWKESDRYDNMAQLKVALEQVYYGQFKTSSFPLTAAKPSADINTMRLFISYRRVDEDFARKVHSALTTQGFDVWLDVVSIRAGEDWSDSIHKGLVGSDIMLLIITPESMESPNVADEWKYFHSRKRPIIPIRLRSVEELHYQLNSTLSIW